MQCLLIYDIPHDGARQKVADACLDYGLARIQYSAFSGSLTRAQQRALYGEVRRRLGGRAGNVQLIALEEASWHGRRVIAQEDHDG
ncbi:MAG: hypothetical protein RLZZ387_1731 [Chloroflexota bacterium]|jgi:CRISPR-associated protein Cas2